MAVACSSLAWEPFLPRFGAEAHPPHRLVPYFDTSDEEGFNEPTHLPSEDRPRRYRWTWTDGLASASRIRRAAAGDDATPVVPIAEPVRDAALRRGRAAPDRGLHRRPIRRIAGRR